MKVAFTNAKILHRDISTGNIMISPEGRGILNDWDHALRQTLKNLPHPTRTVRLHFFSLSYGLKPDVAIGNLAIPFDIYVVW